jgi:hypothetical protein
MHRAVRITVERKNGRLLRHYEIQDETGLRQLTQDVTGSAAAEQEALVYSALGTTKDDVLKRKKDKLERKHA